jgi:hypothetical protein
MIENSHLQVYLTTPLNRYDFAISIYSYALTIAIMAMI